MTIFWGRIFQKLSGNKFVAFIYCVYKPAKSCNEILQIYG